MSDTARVDLGEDNWFEDYEKNMNRNLVEEIATAALHVNRYLFELYHTERLLRQEKNPVALEKLRLMQEKQKRMLALWQPRLADMRRNATYYIRASSFANKEILGAKFFKTQYESLDIDEFLTAICAIRKKAVVNRFFATYAPRKHQYSGDQSYKYASILKLDLKEHFRLTAFYLKQYNPDDEILLGYDPGHFSSLVVAQENEKTVLNSG